jgi:hypothetical protein
MLLWRIDDVRIADATSMQFYLDEHFSEVIAALCRRNGVDVQRRGVALSRRTVGTSSD